MIARIDIEKFQIVLKYETTLEEEQLRVTFSRKIKDAKFRCKGKRWDGTVNYIIGYNKLPLGLWNELRKVCKTFGFPLKFYGLSDIIDNTLEYDNINRFCEKLLDHHKDIANRPMQIDTVFKAIKHRFSMVSVSTAAGKTIIEYMFLMNLFYRRKISKVLIVCPDMDLVVQTHQEFIEYNKARFDLKMGLVHGASKIMDISKYKIIIGNFQSLSNREPAFFKDVDCLIVDECVSWDTVLVAPYGNNIIKNINVGDYVQAADEYGNIIYDKVTYKWFKGTKKIYEIITEDGKSIKCTENHKILTNYGWLYVSDMIRVYNENNNIFCYINDGHKTIDFRNHDGRCQHELRTQRKQIAEIQSEAFNKTERIYDVEVRDIERICGKTKIISIEEKGIEEVYDIETEKTHTFFANGILVHNCHRSGNNSIKYIFDSCTSAKYRLGLSGSILEDKTAEYYTLLAYLGPIVKKVSKKEVIDKGYAAGIKVKIFKLNYMSIADRKKLAMLKHTIEDGEQRLRIEQKIIRESVIRLNWIVAMISKMKGNVLVFFLDKKTGYGRKIMEKVKEKAPMKEVYYVDGDVKKDLREIYKDKMEEGDNKVLVASYDTYSTGKSIKNLHYIVCAESRKGEIVVNQATGRGMRLHHTKDICLWIDIVDDFSINIENYENKNYILRHLSDRIGYYDKWGFERETIEITLDNDGAFGTGIVDAPRL